MSIKYKLSDIIDIDNLQFLLDRFSKVTGAVTALIDLEGNVLMASGWQDICTKFHRINPETCKRCIESDTALAGMLGQGEKYNVYTCKNGLTDIAVPIIIEGEHVGNFFTGQFFFEPPDEAFFRKQAAQYGFKEQEYIEALRRAPIFSQEEIRDIMDFLCGLTTLFAETGLTLVKNREAMDEIRKLREELDEKKKKGGKFLMFMIDGQEYGIPILKVREIIQACPLTPVPEVPQFVKGVFNLRGKIIPAVDLRLLMGITATVDDDERTCIIITEYMKDEKAVMVGMIVDRVSEVSQISGENIEEIRNISMKIDADYVYGMAKSDTDMKILLDVEHFFKEIFDKHR